MAKNRLLAAFYEIATTAKIPIYDRSGLSVGHNTDWSIIDTGVLLSEVMIRDKHTVRDFLTTVVEHGNERTNAEVTGAKINCSARSDIFGQGGRSELFRRRFSLALKTYWGRVHEPRSGFTWTANLWSRE